MNIKYNFTVKTLKSDKGLEYINNRFNDFIKDKGIEFIHSEPGAHQQYGKVERLNQTLDNCARTLLNWAKLPIAFWDEAIVVAAKLYYLNPHQGNYNLVPDDAFFNKKSDISHLAVFGCKVAYFDNYQKDKYNKAKAGIFMGYSDDSTGYRILDINTNNIITALHVYFFEEIPGSINTPSFSDIVINSLFDPSLFPNEGEMDFDKSTDHLSKVNDTVKDLTKFNDSAKDLTESFKNGKFYPKFSNIRQF
eukprot:jgi/Orpsp1_1/1181707/evm.model.c7180000078269.1